MTYRFAICSLCFATLASAIGFAQNKAPTTNPRSLSSVVDIEFLGKFERALSALERSDTKLALTLFSQLREERPQDIWTRVGIATTLLHSREYGKALDEFRSAVRSPNAASVATLGVGATLLSLGRTHEANAELEIASRHSSSANLGFMFAYTLCLDNQHDRAAIECERAERLQPNGPVGTLPDEVRGLIALRAGDRRTAIAFLRRALFEPVLTGRVDALQSVPDMSGRLTRRDMPSRRDDSPSPANSISRRSDASGADTATNSGKRSEATDATGAITKPAAHRLRGVSPITVSTAQAQCVRAVAFQVNDKLRFVANRPPFRWDWDTTRDPDGIYQLSVQLYGEDRVLIKVEERMVEIHNGGPEESAKNARSRAVALPSAFEATYKARFERLLELRPDPLRTRYLVAQAYEAEKLNDFAEEELTLVFTEKPDFLDTRQRLLRIRSRLVPPFKPESLPELRSVLRTDKVVALTFDDGPRPDYTPRILEILREHKVNATFFLVGKMVEAYPQLVRDIAGAGHDLANHSYGHENMAKMSLIEDEQDVLRCERAIHNAAGIRVNKFRPPGGHYGPELKQALAGLGYSVIFWTANITTYADLPPDEIAERLAGEVNSGGIILLHNGADQTIFVLPKLLDSLKRRGFRCVSVSQLLQRPVR